MRKAKRTSIEVQGGTAPVYANEADLLNVALFGQTAKQWRDAHPDAKGNIRDHTPLIKDGKAD